MRGTSPPNYREVMEAVRKLQKERKTMADPYLANLKVIVTKVPILCACDLLICFLLVVEQLARLWRSINDHERALEDYEKACRSLSEKQIAWIPLDERAEVLERERVRVSECTKSQVSLFCNREIGDSVAFVTACRDEKLSIFFS